MLLIIISSKVPLLILACILRGTGSAFLSGSMEALVYEDMKVKGKEKAYAHAVATGMSWLFSGRVCAFLLSGLLYTPNRELPYILMGISFLLCLLVITSMHENKEDASLKTIPGLALFIAAAKELMSRKRVLTVLLSIQIESLMVEPLWVQYQPIMKSAEIPVEWVGFVYAAGAGVSAFGSQLFRKIINRSSVETALFFMLGFASTGSGLLFFQNSPLVIVMAVCVMSVGFGLWWPLVSTITNANVESSYRATALSLVSTVNCICITISTIICSWLADSFGAQVVTVSISLLLFLLIVAALSLVGTQTKPSVVIG